MSLIIKIRRIFYSIKIIFLTLGLPAEVIGGGLIEDPQGGVILAGGCGANIGKLLRLQHVGQGDYPHTVYRCR